MEPSLSIDVIAVCTGEVPSLVVSRSIISYVSIDFTLNKHKKRPAAAVAHSCTCTSTKIYRPPSIQQSPCFCHFLLLLLLLTCMTSNHQTHNRQSQLGMKKETASIIYAYTQRLSVYIYPCIIVGVDVLL